MIASLAESGGAEMLSRGLSLRYAELGHQCHVAYISDAASLGASAEFEQACKNEFDAAGVSYGELGHDCRRNPLVGGRRLRRSIAAFRPDVVHIHLGWGLLFQAFGLIRGHTVYTHHNIVFKFSPRLFRLFDQFVERYIAICGPCLTLLERYVRRPIVLIPNGVPARFAHAAARDEPGGTLELLSVGNLTPQKGYDVLVAAAAKVVATLAAQGRRVHWRIAGEGAERVAIQQAIDNAGLSEQVTLLGARRDIAALMARAHLLVQASQFEGLPIALIEAAMSGLPAIATDVGGCRDIVLDGRTGRLVPPGDPGALADAVLDTLSDRVRYAAFSQAAVEQGRRFTLEHCADQHLDLYRSILPARP